MAVAAALAWASAGLGAAGAPRRRVFFYVRPHVSWTGSRGSVAGRGVAPLENITAVTVTVQSVAIEGGKHVFALTDAVSVPFRMARNEEFDIPVAVLVKEGSGSAVLRIVASAAGVESDTESVKFHYVIRSGEKIK